MIIISLVLITVLATQTSFADCPSQLSKCDVALKAALQLDNDYKTQVLNYVRQSALQQQIIEDQNAKLGSPFRDPTVVVPTVVAVVLTTLLVTKHLK